MNDSQGSTTDGRASVSLRDTAPKRQVRPPSGGESGESGELSDARTSNSGNSVLVLRWDDSRIDEFVRFIERHGFEVHCAIGTDRISESANFGAIIHLARSDKDLRVHLGDEIGAIADEEWVLVAGDGESDFHCTFQLTRTASSDLRAFVHWLWAIGSVA